MWIVEEIDNEHWRGVYADSDLRIDKIFESRFAAEEACDFLNWDRCRHCEQ